MPCTATGRNFAQGRPIAPFALCSRHCWHFCSQCSSQFRAQRSSRRKARHQARDRTRRSRNLEGACRVSSSARRSRSSSRPQEGPRTKPKALNAALPFARGTFTVVYDAEDRPEPDQLRRALDVFRADDDDLACVQARAHHRQHRRQLARAPVHRRICRAVRPVPARPCAAAICRCRSAARPIISAPRCCARSAPGIPTTSPRTPISACGSRASAIARR